MSRLVGAYYLVTNRTPGRATADAEASPSRGERDWRNGVLLIVTITGAPILAVALLHLLLT